MNEEVLVGCSTNDAYAQHAGVMLYSMLKNCSNPSTVRIIVMDGKLSAENKKRLSQIAKQFGASLSYQTPEYKRLEGLREYRHITLETYYRFFLVENPKLKKILYLDADIVVEGDIIELYKTPFEGKCVCAVRDTGASVERKRTLGLPLNEPYFNAGVLLIDCEKWRRKSITEKTSDYLKKNPEKIRYADQDGLNVTLRGDWKELDPSWNVITRTAIYRYVPILKAPDYSRGEVLRVTSSPKIIHYATFLKPWFFLDPSPYKKRYWGYLRETPWKSATYPDKNIRGVLKRVKHYFTFIYNAVKKKD